MKQPARLQHREPEINKAEDAQQGILDLFPHRLPCPISDHAQQDETDDNNPRNHWAQAEHQDGETQKHRQGNETPAHHPNLTPHRSPAYLEFLHPPECKATAEDREQDN